MANILDALGDLPSFFDQSKKTPGSLSYDELQMRRKIAMALASRRSPYPKTIGEGLSALGEGLADRWAMQDATKADAAYSAQDAAARRKLLDPEPDTVPGPPVAPVAPITPPPVAPQAAPPGVPPVAPGGAPAPALAPAPSLVPQRQPAPPPGPAIGALGGDAREMLAMSMTNAQPEGPVGMPSVPEGQPSIQLASLQPSNEPGPRPPTATATVPTSVPSTVPTGEMSNEEWKARVARNETGGWKGDPYQALGPFSRSGDRAYGKYQVMGNNVLKWSEQYLGQSMTPQEFLNNPKAQEAIADARGGEYISKYGPEDAAKAWFAGERGMKRPNSRDSFGTSVSEYARRFNQPLEGREQLARSLASPPPQDLASGEDARLADVTGQAAVQPRVQLASLRNEPTTSDAAPEPMGGVAGGGIGQAADARRAAAALAQQQPETMGLPAKVAQGPGPALPGATVPGPVQQPQIAQAPPAQAPIAKAPLAEERPKPPGPEPTLQSVLAGEPALRLKLQRARETMADPKFANSPTFTFAEKVFTDTRKELQDEYTRKWTSWHEQYKLDEAFRLGGRTRQQAEETHASKQAEAAQKLEQEKLGTSGIPKSVESVATAPARFETTQRIKQQINSGDALTGLLSPQELTFLKAKAAAGLPPDPRIAATERLQADLTRMAGSLRMEVVGPGAVTVYEQQLLAKAAAGNITYDAKTIREVTAAAEKVMLDEMLQHQRKLDQFGKENPALSQTVYDRYGLPMERILPSDHPSVRRMMDNLDHPNALTDFDKKFHTPGLAAKIIEREQRRR